MRHPPTAVRPLSADQIPSIDPLLTAEEVAEVVGVRVDYIWALCRANEIPHLCFGRVKRFRRSAVSEWLEKREQGKPG
jgi:excisionase family DNA binding protein